MFVVTPISQINGAPLSWLLGLLRGWQPTLVVQDAESSPLVDALLFTLWYCGYPLAKTGNGSEVLENVERSGNIALTPPLVAPPIIVSVADPQWKDVLTKRCKVWGRTPEETPEPCSLMVRMAVVSASLWQDEMHSWDVVFVILVDVDAVDEVPVCERAIYVTFSTITPHLVEKLSSGASRWVGKIIAHPPVLLPFGELKGKPYVPFDVRHPVGALLLDDVNRRSDISLWSKKLEVLGIDIVSWDDAANYRAVLLPVNPYIVSLTTLRKVLDLLGQCVFVFTNCWEWATFYPFVYSTFGWGEALSMCLQSCEQFAAQHFGFTSHVIAQERIVGEWLNFVGVATAEGFIFYVLGEAYKLARDIWGVGMLPWSTIWG